MGTVGHLPGGRRDLSGIQFGKQVSHLGNTLMHQSGWIWKTWSAECCWTHLASLRCFVESQAAFHLAVQLIALQIGPSNLGAAGWCAGMWILGLGGAHLPGALCWWLQQALMWGLPCLEPPADPLALWVLGGCAILSEVLPVFAAPRWFYNTYISYIYIYI